MVRSSCTCMAFTLLFYVILIISLDKRFCSFLFFFFLVCYQSFWLFIIHHKFTTLLKRSKMHILCFDWVSRSNSNLLLLLLFLFHLLPAEFCSVFISLFIPSFLYSISFFLSFSSSILLSFYSTSSFHLFPFSLSISSFHSLYPFSSSISSSVYVWTSTH